MCQGGGSPWSGQQRLMLNEQGTQREADAGSHSSVTTAAQLGQGQIWLLAPLSRSSSSQAEQQPPLLMLMELNINMLNRTKSERGAWISLGSRHV